MQKISLLKDLVKVRLAFSWTFYLRLLLEIAPELNFTRVEETAILMFPRMEAGISDASSLITPSSQMAFWEFTK